MDQKKAPIKKAAAKKAPAKRRAPAKKAAAKANQDGPQQIGFDLPGDDRLADILDNSLLVPLRVAAIAFGISETAIKKWRVKHRDKRGRETLYYLPDLIAYRLKRADSGENNLSIERARLARAQSEKTELEVAQLRGDLIPASVILENWEPLVGAARQKVMAIKTKIKTQIPNLTDADLSKVDVICRSALEDLANGGIPKTTKRITRARL